ncbi:hypothetical protein GCWU000246_01720 [Jonquetella anthropi E3_33 E1]|nr:hypothetical protein GCWU000246_01720 [Jonquetella anthropi E3_33 E1]
MTVILKQVYDDRQPPMARNFAGAERTVMIWNKAHYRQTLYR